MADNVVVTPGTGKTIAADEVVDGTLGTVTVQYVKLMDGTLDGTTKAAVGANGLAVNVAAGATSVAKAEDVASADADVGIPAMAVRKATPANTSGTDGDYEMLQMSAGRLWTSTTIDSSQIGTAGTAATPVLSVQGIASMTPIQVVGNTLVASANFNRPADTTAYAVGDLVANNTTAGSVTPLSWTVGRLNDGYITIRRARLKTSSTSVTNAQFRLHLYGATPTVTNGDNGAWLSIESTYLGWIDITVDKAFSDAAKGVGVPTVGSEIIAPCLSGATTIKGLLEARAAYTPTNAGTFTVELEILRD